MLSDKHDTCMNAWWCICLSVCVCDDVFACLTLSCFGLVHVPRPLLPVHNVRRWVGAGIRPLATRIRRLEVTQARVGRLLTKSRMSSQPTATQGRVARVGRPLCVGARCRPLATRAGWLHVTRAGMGRPLATKFRIRNWFKYSDVGSVAR